MKKIILQACCAPCACYPIKKLISDNYMPVVFFYNPNIFPYKEYLLRKNELENYCRKINVEFFSADYDIKKFYNETKGYELEPEKGKRCSICFKLRLLKTAQFALTKNINCYTTTLSVSPYKNYNQILQAAYEVKNLTGVDFVEYNFKKQDGFRISRLIAKENNMYAQNYCGCLFSMRNNK